MTAVSKSAVHEAVISAEQTARQELIEALERQRVEHHREREKLLLEVCVLLYMCVIYTPSFLTVHCREGLGTVSSLECLMQH